MKTRVGPSSKEYKTFDQLKEELTDIKEVIVLGIFENDKQSKSDTQSQFFKASDKLRETVLFRHVFIDSVPKVYDFELLKNLKDVSSPIIVLIRPKHLRNKFETNYVVYSFGQIEDFIRLNYHGLVGLRDYNNRDEFKPPIVITYYEVNYENDTKKANYWRNRILSVAKNHRDLRFAISNVHNSASDLKGFGFKSLEEVLDVVPIITARDEHDRKFILNDKFSVDNLAKFVNDFKNQNLEPFVLSEQLPKDNENSFVKVAVANNLEELVLNSDKESFIEFYSPDCGNCVRLEPIFEELGKLLKSEPKIQIVKMNYVANDVPKMFNVRAFPTFYWFDKNKQSHLYDGERELNHFIEFIAKNSAHQLQQYDRDGNRREAKVEL